MWKRTHGSSVQWQGEWTPPGRTNTAGRRRSECIIQDRHTARQSLHVLPRRVIFSSIQNKPQGYIIRSDCGGWTPFALAPNRTSPSTPSHLDATFRRLALRFLSLALPICQRRAPCKERRNFASERERRYRPQVRLPHTTARLLLITGLQQCQVQDPHSTVFMRNGRDCLCQRYLCSMYQWSIRAHTVSHRSGVCLSRLSALHPRGDPHHCPGVVLHQTGVPSGPR